MTEFIDEPDTIRNEAVDDGLLATINRTTELLPCPFCGGEAEIIKDDSGKWHISTRNCGYGNSFHHVFILADTESEAITAWNTRTTQIMANDGKCKIIGTSTNNLMYPDYMTKWYELSCGHSVTLKGGEPPRFCPNCGRKVVSA